MNAALLRARATVLTALRTTLAREGFLEVQPPVLVRSPALEANLESVVCADGFLHTSPEFALKRVLAAGLPRIYAMTPAFRNEEAGRHHSREFTLLELYLHNANYLDLIPLVEGLVSEAARALTVATPRFSRTTVAALFGGAVTADDDEFFRRWVTEIDATLTSPTWVLDFPARQAALAEVRGEVCERLELYLGGLELANGYSELRDGAELRRRFAQSAASRLCAGRAPHPTDEGVIAATDRLPRTAGIALGVDRLVMALTGTPDIADVQIER
ncbi:MAG: EF-P lysine aminoacylase GenX [Myxococcales bacterium]|nr:EF-P lysine aminoacylase GenX [Myxococcales bacterium]